ncbi:MAG: hypothetical protein U0802_11345 [Candidatus Binatia bacterium]
MLRRLAAERAALPIAAGCDYRVAGAGDSLDFDGLDVSLRHVRLALRGAYQRDNAATALAALAAVRHAVPVSEAALRQGLASVRWPGRLEVVAGLPLAVLDGAHNVDGVEQLVAELLHLLGGREDASVVRRHG